MLIVGSDTAWTWPSGAQYVAVGVREVYFYSGPALPTQDVINDWIAHGLDLVGILERTSDRAESSGYAGGVEDAQYHLARLASRGLTNIKLAFVMSDGSSFVPSGNLPGTAEYSRGVGDVVQRWFVVYGNEFSVSAAQRGTPLALVDWLPETWTQRQGQGIRQLVGPVPIDGIDLDHRFIEWPGAAPAKPKGARGMWTALHVKPDHTVEACAVGGFCWVGDVAGAPGAFGIPQEAIDAHTNDGIPMRVVDDNTWARIIGSAQAPTYLIEQHILAAIAALPAGQGGGVSKADVLAVVEAALNGTTLHVG